MTVCRVVRKKVTVLLSTSLAWPPWVDCGQAELFSQPGTNFSAQPCTFWSFNFLKLLASWVYQGLIIVRSTQNSLVLDLAHPCCCQTRWRPCHRSLRSRDSYKSPATLRRAAQREEGFSVEKYEDSTLGNPTKTTGSKSPFIKVAPCPKWTLQPLTEHTTDYMGKEMTGKSATLALRHCKGWPRGWNTFLQKSTGTLLWGIQQK